MFDVKMVVRFDVSSLCPVRPLLQHPYADCPSNSWVRSASHVPATDPCGMSIAKLFAILNGMRPMHHRDPAIVGVAMDACVVLEAVNEGVHLHEATVRLLRSVAPGRVALVTDAIAAACAADDSYHPRCVRRGDRQRPDPTRQWHHRRVDTHHGSRWATSRRYCRRRCPGGRVDSSLAEPERDQWSGPVGHADPATSRCGDLGDRLSRRGGWAVTEPTSAPRSEHSRRIAAPVVPIGNITA